MEFMKDILLISYWIIIILEILCAFWNILKTYIAKRKINSIKIYENSNKLLSCKILIIIPCLREQNIIKETIDYFLNLINDKDNIELIIVTTEKEKYEQLLDKQKRNKTTLDVVNEYISENKINKVKLFHYPHKDGIMADQLNYVMKKYKKYNSKKTYFCVYNADSRPNSDTINSVLNIIKNQDYPEIIQQYSYAFSNLGNLSFIMKGFALYQSNFEIKYGLINSLTFSNLLYTYVVGHGLYIRLDILKKIGGFDNKFWCEDIYMSSIIRNRNIKITPVLSLENMETPKNISILIKQNANWYKTSNQWIKMIKSNLKKDKKISNSCKNWLFQRVRMNLSWLLLPFFIILSFAISIYYKSIILLVISILSYTFMQICTYISTIKIIEKLENKKINNKLSLICAACISTFISNIGPLYSIFNFKMKKYKTER